ncbi:MAG: serine/threonine-protein phosphatase [Planctomycetes bacterium]|nr:serine/threonine-protein phosphatase [Planctomycetota bacterium]
MDLIQKDESKQSKSEVYPNTLDNLYYKYISLKIRRTNLWNEVCNFARWVEQDASSLARQRNQDEIWIDLDLNSNVHRLWIGEVEDHKLLIRYRILWEYLVSLGIRKLCLDPRLEMNQIQDLFVFIKSREKIVRSRERASRNAVSAGLLDGQNIHFSCANVILQDEVLFVKYSYCTLRYSHLVHWFERHNKKFRDHRSLFHIAPRGGLLVAAVILTPSILFAAWYQEWPILLMLLAAALVLYGVAYLSLMVVGSVEYDNEEKAYQLSRAYSQLKFYASRVEADIHRAQTIQQCFLPDTSKMPMRELVDWASSYLPADEVGGDYFDIKSLDDDRIVIIFADVCGHGMAAALVTAVIKTTFQDWLETSVSLENLALQFNQNIYLTTPPGYFAAIFLMILNGKTGQLEYINCGHQPEPWVLHGTDDGVNDQLDQARCMILGIEETVDINKAVISLKSGDGVLIASDGIVENQDIEGQLYGQERFEELLQKNTTLPIKDLTRLIVREAELFSKGTSLKDDQTLLVFRIKPC